jgi:hypothetical protein
MSRLARSFLTARTRVRVVVFIVTAAAAAAVLAIVLLPAGASGPPNGRLAVRVGQVTLPGRYVSGAALLRGRAHRALARRAFAPLTGTHVAVPSRSGRLIAYDTWAATRVDNPQLTHDQQGIKPGDRMGIPTLRVLDTATRMDRALEPGSFSASWSSKGAIAYTVLQTGAYRADVPNLTKVVVRRSPHRAPVAWTPYGRYGVFGWAGKTLIAGTAEANAVGATVLALEGPGKVRKLLSYGVVLAISPDGTKLLTATRLSPPGAAVLHLIRLSDRSELAALPLARIVDPVTKAGTQFINGPVHWRGNLLLATTDAGFAVLRVRGNRLTVDQTMHFDLARYTAGSVFEARFAGGGTRTLAFWTLAPKAEASPLSVQFVCDRIALSCARQVSSALVQPVYDRSGGR